MARGSAANRVVFELGSFRSPKVIAPVGQDSMQAGITAPSASFPGSPRRAASARASWMRCTQKEHFSITPRLRTVTSGLFFI